MTTIYHKFYELDKVNAVVEKLDETVKTQKFMSLAEFNEICGEDPFVEDEDIGWTDKNFDVYVTKSSNPITLADIYTLHVPVPITPARSNDGTKKDSLSEERKTDLFETPDHEPKTEKEKK